MPILEPVPDDSELSQGDVLRGVNLFETKESWIENGKSRQAKAPLCLVLSRPCVAAHKNKVIVANIAKYPEGLDKDLATFDRALHALTKMRDGFGSPDLFFLGQMPGQVGRFCARFDSLHTIAVPEDADDRKAFLAATRIARLHIDFIRDLHVRIFNAFASIGFDDQGWIPDEELNWLVTKGDADIKKAEAELTEMKAKHGQKSAAGQQNKPAEIENLERALAKVQEAVAPYAQEQQKRQQVD